jgi:hypothetical protein
MPQIEVDGANNTIMLANYRFYLQFMPKIIKNSVINLARGYLWDGYHSNLHLILNPL